LVLLGGFFWAGFFGRVFYCQPWEQLMVYFDQDFGGTTDGLF
jgi:hypothetical protein